MKRPLLMVALSYASGIVLAELSPVSLPTLALLLTAAVLAALAIMRPETRPALLWVVLVLSGAANLASHTAVLSPLDLRTLLGTQAAIVSVRGELPETPYHRVYEHHERPSWRTLAQLDVHAIRRNGGEWQRAFGRVMVSTPGVLSNGFFGGRQVEIEGVLQPPKRAVAEGLFDYRQYLERHGIYYQLQVASPADWRVRDEPQTHATPPIADRFGLWAKSMLGRGLPVEDEPLQLLWAMSLGWKTALTGEVSEPFMRSGTMHVFAISGLHIALISGILVAVLRVFHVPRVACGIFVIPLIWAYTGLTGWQASAIRSTIMMSVIIAGWSLRRPSDLLNSLAAAAFIILLWDPQQLFQASFQLSFAVVLSLALFIPVLESLRQHLLQQDPLLPDELRPRWQKWLRAPLNFVTTGFATSLAAWLGSIPLIAFYFHLFTPISLLANLIVVPLSSAALASNLASLFVGAWIPAAAELFNHSAWFFMWLMIRVSQWAAQWPGGCFYIAAPSAAGFVLYYALLISIMAGWLIRPRVRVWTAVTLGTLGLAWAIEFWQSRTATHLNILPAGGGEAVYCKPSRSSEDLLIDCGNESAVSFITKPFLRGQGVNRLDGLLLTHGDIHNIGGAEMIRNAFSPHHVFISPVSFRSAAYRAAMENLRQTPGLSRTIEAGEIVGPWTTLHPDARNSFPQADDNAIVLRGEIEGLLVLLLSDLGKPGQNALMNRQTNLLADIVVTGLPTQSEPLADALLDAIQPRVIIVTDSESPATARANQKLRERLAARELPVLYTRETGAVTLRFRNKTCRLRTLSGIKLVLRAEERVHAPSPTQAPAGE